MSIAGGIDGSRGNAAAPRPFPGGGATGALIAALDAASSPLGPVADWSPALRQTVATMLPAAAQIVLFWGPEFVALYNDTYAPTIGLKHPAALGRPAREGWAELWDDLHPLLARVRDTGETFADRDRAFYLERHGHGETVYFDISYSIVPEADGSVGGVLCLVAETTDRVRAAKSLTEERARLAEMFDQAPSFMAVLRQPGHVLELVNASYQQLIGHRGVIGLPLRDALPELADQGFFEMLDSVAATGRVHHGYGERVGLQREAGGTVEERYLDFICQPIADAQGAITAIFVEGSDVTDRRLAEERLALSEETLRLAVEATELGTWDLDLATDTLLWSDRTKAMFGISPHVPCSMADFYAGLHPEDVDAASAAFAAAIDPERRAIYDVEYRTVGAEDGEVRWVAAKGRGLFDAAGACVRAVGTTLDITGRKRDDERLRESEARFRQIADTAPALIWVTDDRARVVFASRGFETLLGVAPETLHGDGWHRLLHPDDWTRIAGRDPYGEADIRPWSFDVRLLDRHGATRWMHAEGRPRFIAGQFQGFVACAVDVTDAHLAAEALERGIAAATADLAAANVELKAQIEERERVEATLHQMQRLEAVGQLTSGVAHDFNNLLTVVLGNTGMLERWARDQGVDGKVATRLAHVRTAAERGAALTAQLLAFSRRQRLEAKATDLNATVAGMGPLLASSLGNAIRIETRLVDALWPALVDPTQIELIILNLAINARDAMEVGGTLGIETTNATLGAPARPEDPPAGDYVVVSVCDDGTGMTPEVLAKAFEPFFTTKEVGKGSGLGLAQVFGFAKQSGGGVRIDTVAGQGTTVHVYLPRTEPAAAAAPDEKAAAPVVLDGATVLVVDDDDGVRSVTAAMLAEAGCHVAEAAGGAAALALLDARDDIDMVVADFAMPGMNGAELARRVAAAYPQVPLLIVTGYADRSAIHDVAEDAILHKPFAAPDLLARVGRALDARAPARTAS